MPPRAPLTPISGNIAHRKELTPIQRAEICTAYDWGGSVPEIARRYNVPESMIRTTLKQAP
jgi:Mor family transcriptional regulator